MSMEKKNISNFNIALFLNLPSSSNYIATLISTKSQEKEIKSIWYLTPEALNKHDLNLSPAIFLAYAGRPPVSLTANLTLFGEMIDVHLKACWQKRLFWVWLCVIALQTSWPQAVFIKIVTFACLKRHLNTMWRAQIHSQTVTLGITSHCNMLYSF